MEKASKQKLKIIANQLRQDVIEMLVRSGSGHSGGSLGMADIFAVLYFHILKHTPKNPNNPLRDRLVLSNGHICPVLYAALARSGYFPLIKLKNLRQINSPLQGHPHNLSLSGVEVSSGPLGQGISQAVGMALAGQMDKKNHHVFCLVSDGEHNEGQFWEAVMAAKKFHLKNLIVIVDKNNIQIDGYTKDIMPLDPLKEKYQAFGWSVREIDGHNFSQIISALQKARKSVGPIAIIAKTIMGKGVSFMENKYQWHGKAPNKEEGQKALEELKNAK
ncbi:MAG: transketolase [Patescibacteria group bacterium]|nr:transketolase [Patescibacteria group bacterium]